MLIAIMGDAFDQAIENKESNRKRGLLNIMGEYVELTVRDGDTQRKEEYIVDYRDEERAE